MRRRMSEKAVFVPRLCDRVWKTRQFPTGRSLMIAVPCTALQEITCRIYNLTYAKHGLMFSPSTAKAGNHIMTVFPDSGAALDGALQFLRHGISNNEVVMLIVDAPSKEEILHRMSQEWAVDARALEREGEVIVKSTAEWYFPDGIVDPNRIINKWNALASMCMMMDNKKTRVCGIAGGFFNAGLGRELIKYESCLAPQFDDRITALCAYTEKELDSLSTGDIEALEEHHGLFWVYVP